MTTTLWTGKEVQAYTSGAGFTEWIASSVAIDSRALHAGDLFIALQGPNFDAHNFINDVFEKGAAAAIVKKNFDSKGAWWSKRVIYVQDTQDALVHLAQRARARYKGRIIAVTGSAGKTSVKTGIAHALSFQKSVSSSFGNYNNHIGVPLSLCRLPRTAAFGVFEVGMNAPGEIKTLGSFIEPHVSLITTVAPTHMATFSDFDALLDEKADIFNCAEIGILNRDFLFYNYLRRKAKTFGMKNFVTFGASRGATIRFKGQEIDKCGKQVSINVSIGGKSVSYKLPNIGEHWVMNSLAMVAGILALGADPFQAAQDLEHFYPLSGRGEQFSIHGIEVIDDAYNASPIAMKMGLKRLKAMDARGKKIAVLGEMRELGHETKKQHQELTDFILEHIVEAVDGFIFCGSFMRDAYEALPKEKQWGYGEDVEKIFPYICSRIRAGDILFLKGANSLGMQTIIKRLRLFDFSFKKQGEKECSIG